MLSTTFVWSISKLISDTVALSEDHVSCTHYPCIHKKQLQRTCCQEIIVCSYKFNSRLTLLYDVANNGDRKVKRFRENFYLIYLCRIYLQKKILVIRVIKIDDICYLKLNMTPVDTKLITRITRISARTNTPILLARSCS